MANPDPVIGKEPVQVLYVSTYCQRERKKGTPGGGNCLRARCNLEEGVVEGVSGFVGKLGVGEYGKGVIS